MVFAVSGDDVVGLALQIWAILKTFLDSESQQRFVLCKGDYTATLKSFISDEVLSDTLGGNLNVTSWLLDRQAGYAADQALAQLEQDMSGSSGTEIGFDGQAATEVGPGLWEKLAVRSCRAGRGSGRGVGLRRKIRRCS